MYIYKLRLHHLDFFLIRGMYKKYDVSSPKHQDIDIKDFEKGI